MPDSLPVSDQSDTRRVPRWTVSVCPVCDVVEREQTVDGEHHCDETPMQRVEVVPADLLQVCGCGLAGTNITQDGLCATCGRPLNRESVAWLAREFLSNARDAAASDQFHSKTEDS